MSRTHLPILNSSTLAHYSFYPHISLCRTADYTVLLDRKKTRYLGAVTAHIIGLAPYIANWPWPEDCRSSDKIAANPDAAELLAHMIESGMVTPEPSGKVMLPAEITPPSAELIEGYLDVETRATARDLVNFLRSTVTALVLLRLCSFETLYRRLQSRRTLCVSSSSYETFELNADKCRILISKFKRLFGFFFSQHNICLFYAVALSDFLAQYGIYPRFVVGVATNPFSAHCWLQHADFALTDPPEAVHRFTPILVV